MERLISAYLSSSAVSNFFGFFGQHSQTCGYPSQALGFGGFERLFWREYISLAVGDCILLSGVGSESLRFWWGGAFGKELRGLRFMVLLAAYGETAPKSASADGERALGDRRSPLYEVRLLAVDMFHVDANDELAFGPNEAVEECEVPYWEGRALTGEFLLASICIERR